MTVKLYEINARVVPDSRDEKILARRIEDLNAIGGFGCGDWVDFADGVSRRISHIWPEGPQTSDGGSFYLGNGYLSFSGSLYGIVPNDSLTLTDERRDGNAWFFHHDLHQAHHAVGVTLPFRVYTCSLPAPR